MAEFQLTLAITLLFVHAVVALYLFLGEMSPTAIQVSFAVWSAALIYIASAFAAVTSIVAQEVTPYDPTHEHPIRCKDFVRCTWCARAKRTVGSDVAFPGDSSIVQTLGTVKPVVIPPETGNSEPKGRISARGLVSIMLYTLGVFLVMPSLVLALNAQKLAFETLQVLILCLTVFGAVNYVWFIVANRVGACVWRFFVVLLTALTVTTAALGVYVSIECT